MVSGGHCCVVECVVISGSIGRQIRKNGPKVKCEGAVFSGAVEICATGAQGTTVELCFSGYEIGDEAEKGKDVEKVEGSHELVCYSRIAVHYHTTVCVLQFYYLLRICNGHFCT